ncbi:class I SAM-dependent methyltransferase [Pilimelia columellifera]|uniref:Class I SAM-dependent methyltransferase n=1 Tax=Pilimelia columellifera subsp. columellifera TaxID=706583 RepID=A0ABN3MYW9_9ACTN
MDTNTARAWLARWDAQQEHYIADREERFTVIADLVASATANQPQPSVVDLGCGPGSLSTRLAERLPKATIVGVDTDPLLLALARSAHPDARWVDADLTAPGWPAVAGLADPIDAAVSTTALHWIAEDDLAGIYRELADLIRPGGIFVNADHLYDEQSTVGDLAEAISEARAERAGVTANENWESWWAAAAADPELAGLVAERERHTNSGHTGNRLSAAGHARLLRAAGFAQVGVVWQYGNDTVLAAVR